MPVSVVYSDVNTTVGSTLTIPDVPSSGGNAIVAVAGWRRNAGQTLDSVVRGASSFTSITATEPTHVSLAAWRLVAPSGTEDVVMTFSASLSNGGFGAVYVLSGVDQTTPIGTPSADDGNGTALSASVNGDTDGLFLDVLAINISGGFGGDISDLTPNSGQTSHGTAPQNGVRGATSEKAGAASTSLGWTWTGSRTGGIIVIPVMASGVAPPVRRRRMLLLGVG